LIHISIYEITSYIEFNSRPKAKTGAPKSAKISRRTITNTLHQAAAPLLRRHPASFGACGAIRRIRRYPATDWRAPFLFGSPAAFYRFGPSKRFDGFAPIGGLKMMALANYEHLANKGDHHRRQI
jgi:hypothetical protein